MHFLMTSVMPVCGADGPQDEALQRQLMSMGNLLRWRRNEELIDILFESGLLYLTRFSQSPCEWKNVACAEDFVTALHWDKTFLRSKGQSVPVVEIRRPDLRWLPSTLESVNMAHQVIGFDLKARLLPKNLRDLRLNSCELRGLINLSIMPEPLEFIDLRNNAICGTVYLIDLPLELREAFLSGNVFQRIIIDNDGLPEKLERIELDRAFGKNLVPISFAQDEQVLDNRIAMRAWAQE